MSTLYRCKCLPPKRKQHFGPWRLWNSKNERPFNSGKSENQDISRQWRRVCENLARLQTFMENCNSKKPPSSIPLISVSVTFCHLLPPPISLTRTSKSRRKKIVTWSICSICSQPCTICNISMRSFFTSQAWPPKPKEMQAMPPNSSQPAVKIREIRRCQSNLNLMPCSSKANSLASVKLIWSTARSQGISACMAQNKRVCFQVTAVLNMF